MTFTRVRGPHMLSLALLAGAALVPAGCGGGDGVSTYNVPKSTDSGKKDAGDPPPAAPAAAGGDYRILGAMFPAGKPGWYWYFKFVGPAELVGTHEADFDKMAKSVKLQADPTTVPSLDLPAGWARTGPRVTGGGGVQMRFDEVLKVGGLECTVSYVGGGVDGNVGRWAGQVGAPPAAKATTEFTANGVTALRVDLRGPRNPVGGPMMGKR